MNVSSLAVEAAVGESRREVEVTSCAVIAESPKNRHDLNLEDKTPIPTCKSTKAVFSVFNRRAQRVKKE